MIPPPRYDSRVLSALVGERRQWRWRWRWRGRWTGCALDAQLLEWPCVRELDAAHTHYMGLQLSAAPVNVQNAIIQSVEVSVQLMVLRHEELKQGKQRPGHTRHAPGVLVVGESGGG